MLHLGGSFEDISELCFDMKAVPLWAPFAPNASKLKSKEMYLMLCTIIPSVRISYVNLNIFTF